MVEIQYNLQSIARFGNLRICIDYVRYGTVSESYWTIHKRYVAEELHPFVLEPRHIA